MSRNQRKSQAQSNDNNKLPEAETVVMLRNGKSADVHVDEVENYKRGGWELKNK